MAALQLRSLAFALTPILPSYEVGAGSRAPKKVSMDVQSCVKQSQDGLLALLLQLRHSVFCAPEYDTRQIVPPVSSAISSAPSLATASAAGRPQTSARRSPEAQNPTRKFS